MGTWPENPKPLSGEFLFSRGLSGDSTGDVSEVISKADRICKGEFCLYSHLWVEFGDKPDWHRNPLSGETSPSDVHWTAMGDFGFGDIKNIWEPSRFSWAFDLCRAYAATQDERYRERFRRLLADWMEKNPPNTGVNWRCGQEASIRLFACLFARQVFADEGIDRMVDQLAEVTAERVVANIGYALSQKNNHGTSEAALLLTVGLLYDEVELAERGTKLLQELSDELIYEDGGTSQHSFNYARVMLDTLTWCSALLDSNSQQVPQAIRSALSRCAEHLYLCQDEESGWLSNFGSNDGALLFPLTDCHYRDYRPSIQAAWVLAEGKRIYGSGAWDDMAYWLLRGHLDEADFSPMERKSFNAPVSGIHVLRASGGDFCLIRCGGFRHRPAHADQLHVDIWQGGENVAWDPGSFSYNEPAPFDSGFKNTRFHNTVEVDGLDQMDKAGRFLWLPWCKGNSHGIRREGELEIWEGEHDGYRRLVSPVEHRRAVIRHGASFLVLDGVTDRGGGVHDFTLRWMGANADLGDCLATQLDSSKSSALGWRAPFYQERIAGSWQEVRVNNESRAVFASWFGAGILEPSTGGNEEVVSVGNLVVSWEKGDGLWYKVALEGPIG